MSAIRYGINLIYLLKLNKIDNVFYITLESSIMIAVASKFLKNKNFFVITGTYVLRQSKNLRSIVIKIFSLFQSTKNKFIFQNHEDQNFFKKFLKKHFSTVIKGNGINLDMINFSQLKAQKESSLYLQVTYSIQRELEYFDAAVAMKNTDINADFFIAGRYKRIMHFL